MSGTRPNPPRRPTMIDVARQAGVSLKTVSRVVNGESVSEQLAARVSAAIDDLGYRPDDRARSLRQSESRTGTVGFVLVDVANPFFSAILRGIEEVARSRDCLVLAGSTDGSEEREHQLIEAFIDRRLDGLIVVPSSTRAGALEAEIRRGTPVVVLDLELNTELPHDLVRSDHYGGGVAATRHLVSQGHRRIAYLGDDPRIFSASGRFKGFTDVMGAHGLDVDEGLVIVGSHSADGWYPLALELLSSHQLPTAMFTAQNFATMGAVRALHRLGLQHQIAVVGFDDVDLGETVDPAITVIPQHPRDLGLRAAEILFRRIDGDDAPPIREIIDHRMIVRGSGEIGPSTADDLGPLQREGS